MKFHLIMFPVLEVEACSVSTYISCLSVTSVLAWKYNPYFPCLSTLETILHYLTL